MHLETNRADLAEAVRAIAPDVEIVAPLTADRDGLMGPMLLVLGAAEAADAGTWRRAVAVRATSLVQLPEGAETLLETLAVCADFE